jgi:hypothetical protein
MFLPLRNVSMDVGKLESFHVRPAWYCMYDTPAITAPPVAAPTVANLPTSFGITRAKDIDRVAGMLCSA